MIYPVEHLAETFGVSDTAVKRHLRELEAGGWIHRRREIKNGPNHIYLCLPESSIKKDVEGTKCTDEREKMPSLTGRKVPPNNRRKQQEQSNYYQHREDESL